jgi:predicted nucleic acid-binding Zn ribbon protein
MPIQEFECTHVMCRTRFEKVYLSQDSFEAARRVPHQCPKCPYSAEAVINRPAPPKFKGTGFHVTDYDKNGAKGGSNG